jgi:cytochrome c
MNGGKFGIFIFTVLISCGIALFSGTLSRIIYNINNNAEKRGFAVEVSEVASTGGTAAIAGAKLVEIGLLFAEATIDEGKKIAMRCSLCHTFNKGEKNKVGPNLWNIVNAAPAQTAGFAYSSAMLANKEKWSLERLVQYLHKPSKVVPGTKMSFAGLSNEKELVAVVKYLDSLSDSPAPPPAKDEKISLN